MRKTAPGGKDFGVVALRMLRGTWLVSSLLQVLANVLVCTSRGTMKTTNLICLFAFSLLAFASVDAHADDSGFRFDIGAAMNWSPDVEATGYGVVLEPKWKVNRDLGLGLRLTAGGRQGASVGDMVTADQAAQVSALAKGEYSFLDGTFRPFVGGGLGVYYVGAQSVSASAAGGNISQQAGRHFGVAPQVGLDMGRFRLAATYNLLFGADLEVNQMIGENAEDLSKNQNSFGVELSFRFGKQ